MAEVPKLFKDLDNQPGITVEQRVDRAVSFAVERREEEYQRCQYKASDGSALPLLVEIAFEEVLHHVHNPGKIERYQSAEDSQGDEEGNTLGDERLALDKEELQVITGEDISHRGRGYRGEQQGHYRDGRKVGHQHLQGEKHPGDGGLEDSGYTGRGAAAHKNHKHSRREPERLAEIGTDGGPGIYDGTFRSYRTAEPDGD